MGRAGEKSLNLLCVAFVSAVVSAIVSVAITKLLAVKYLNVVDDYADKVMNDINKAITEAISKRK